MEIAGPIQITKRLRSIGNYLEVLKPRETSLLTFIGICAAVVAAGGYPNLERLLITAAALLAGCAGCNGLTNYADREVDARMRRTRGRALPSRRIHPAERMLPLALILLAAGLALAWWLHPLCFLAGLVGTVAALINRKTAATHFLGIVSSWAPVLVGYLAIKPQLDPTVIFLCILIGIWVPLHVWSVMTANRSDYLGAGLAIFPVTWQVKDAIRLLLALSLVLYAVSFGLYLTGRFGWLYLVAAAVLGGLMVFASLRLLLTHAAHDAWVVYKLSAFPYLGLLLLAMCLDLWL
jgi:protoheme IX farnesyltransferase